MRKRGEEGEDEDWRRGGRVHERRMRGGRNKDRMKRRI